MEVKVKIILYEAGPFTFKTDATCLSYICVYSAHCLFTIIPLPHWGPLIVQKNEQNWIVLLFVSISNHFYDKNLEGQLDKTIGRNIGDKVLKLQIEMTPDQTILYELNLSRAPVPSYTWADGTCWDWDILEE